MLRTRWLVAMVVAGFMGLTAAGRPAQAGGSVATPLSQAEWTVRLETKEVAWRWTMWYRKGGGRWHGISGLSYDDACRLSDDYERRGYSTYIARDGR